MNKKLLIVAPLAVLFACGEGTGEKKEVVKLETYKDKLSYSMGADYAQPFVEGQSPQMPELNLDLIAKGFEANLNENDASDCQQVLQNAFGPQFKNFDTTMIDEGSECLGKLSGSELYRQMKEIEKLEAFDLDKLVLGFKDGLEKGDTLVPKAERAKILKDFVADVQKVQQEKMAAAEEPFLEEAKNRPNTTEIDGGIVIETIKTGSGGSPTMYDDVEAHYILTNAVGDTMESSVAMGSPLKMNLQNLIPGWTMSFPQLKKGGKYRLFIPSQYAYKNGALCFYIELLDFGPAGTIAQPMQQPQPQGM